jgi:hypothetical protein
VVGRSCRTRGPSGGLTAAAARGAALPAPAFESLNGRADVVNDALVVATVGAGFVQNFAQPGGNITGNTTLITEMAPKRVELLRELVPML